MSADGDCMIKCLPILLYGLESYSIRKADLHSLMRFETKLFGTANKDIIKSMLAIFNFPLPTEMLRGKKRQILF